MHDESDTTKRHTQRGMNMPCKIVRRVACSMLALSLGPGSVMAGQATRPGASVPDTLQQRIAACTSCHGKYGEGGTDGFNPRLAGKPALYLYHQMLNFRDGRREYPLMSYMMRPLSDTYLHEIADYFATSKPAYPDRLPPDLGPGLMARGQRLATRGDRARNIPACQACHGKRLTGVEPAIPGLLGLPYGYISAQLGAWRTGTRSTRAPDCMRQVADRLTIGDIRAVSAWLAAQPVPGDAAAQATDSLPGPMPLHCGSVEDAP